LSPDIVTPTGAGVRVVSRCPGSTCGVLMRNDCGPGCATTKVVRSRCGGGVLIAPGGTGATGGATAPGVAPTIGCLPAPSISERPLPDRASCSAADSDAAAGALAVGAIACLPESLASDRPLADCGMWRGTDSNDAGDAPATDRAAAWCVDAAVGPVVRRCTIGAPHVTVECIALRRMAPGASAPGAFGGLAPRAEGVSESALPARA
jgi:hypothetical protein